MSRRLTEVSYTEFERFLKHIGCTFVGQEGSHRKWKRHGLNRPIIVPARTLRRLWIKCNLRTLGFSTREYLEIMEKL